MICKTKTYISLARAIKLFPIVISEDCIYYYADEAFIWPFGNFSSSWESFTYEGLEVLTSA
jgi:hypothetical protein